MLKVHPLSKKLRTRLNFEFTKFPSSKDKLCNIVYSGYTDRQLASWPAS